MKSMERHRTSRFAKLLGQSSPLSSSLCNQLCIDTPNAGGSITSKRSVWTLSPLLEEANKVTLWRCERFFTFKGIADKVTPLYHSKPTSDVETPLHKMKAAANKREAVVIVNGPLPEDHRFNACWNPASIRICADGGSTRLHTRSKGSLSPDHIIGDLDSSNMEVLEYYKKKGVAIVHDKDQESTDLQKALAHLKKMEVIPNGLFDTIHILGGLGGCLTHELSNLNSLYQNSGRKMFIVSPGNVAFLLPKGRHIIRIVKKVEDHEDDDEGTKEEIDERWNPPTTVYCGMLPLGEKCLNAVTKGLRWNLQNQALEFGTLISTSNEVLHNMVEVEVSNPVLWTFDFRNDAVV